MASEGESTRVVGPLAISLRSAWAPSSAIPGIEASVPGILSPSALGICLLLSSSGREGWNTDALLCPFGRPIRDEFR